MRKRFLQFLLAIIALAACTARAEQEEPCAPGLDPALIGQPVTITFSVPNVLLTPSVKGIEDSGVGLMTGAAYLDPEKLYVVVCGHSQSIKYIRKAEPVRDSQDQPVTELVDIGSLPDYPLTDTPAGTKVTLHKFTVQLELDDSDRSVHFLGNIDERQLTTGSYAHQVLPQMLSFDGKQAYWQKVYVKHIHPLMDGDQPVKEGASYLPDTYTQNQFAYIPLIRNYAKIQVTDATDPSDGFELDSYAIINTPQRGSVVPYHYGSETPFDFKLNYDPTDENQYRFSGYELCNFTTMVEDLDYPGYLPSGVELDEYVPTVEEFEHPDGVRVLKYNKDDPDQGFYLYERGIPTATMDPTFIIIRGRFGTTDYYYYRLDLMETRMVNYESVYQYYPVYRNFCYNILLNRISSQGLESPEAAKNSSTAEDISADFSMRYLGDISNGKTRLVVEPYMSRTLTGPSEDDYYYLYARFFNDINSPDPNTLWGAVTVELEPMEDNSEDILVLYDDQGHEIHGGGLFFPEAQEMDNQPGFRIIRFNTKTPRDETKTQKIRITGRNQYAPDTYPLYREVEITLQKKQTMKVDCDQPELTATKGSKQKLRISIPDDLPSSMFPLDFIIEAERQSLTPDNKTADNNLPVQTGLSISDNAPYRGKTTFQFVRTLTLDQYKALTPDDEDFVTFECVFRSNRDDSATTIWVYNEYFDKKSVTFTNKEEIGPEPADPGNYFYVQADEPCYVKFNINNLDCLLPGEDWKSYDKSVISLESGERVYFRSSKNTNYSNSVFKCSSKSDMSDTKGQFRVGGNLASLLVGDSFETEGASFDSSYAFGSLFKGHTGLSDASALVMPMLTCPASAYNQMFRGCSALTAPPSALPATTLNNMCYFQMFYQCTALVTIPDFPHDPDETYVLAAGTDKNSLCFQMFYGCNALTTLEGKKLFNSSTPLRDFCFQDMFSTCTRLATVPDDFLPATTLAQSCYRGMFQQTALTRAPELLAPTLVKDCYRYMFNACKSLAYIKCYNTTSVSKDTYTQNWLANAKSSGEFHYRDGVTWYRNDASGIPTGWTPVADTVQ